MKTVEYLYNTYLSYDADAVEAASDQGFYQFKEETDYGRATGGCTDFAAKPVSNASIASLFAIGTLLAFCSLIFF